MDLSVRPVIQALAPDERDMTVSSHGGRWTEAKWLRIGDHFLTKAGKRATVAGLTIRIERVKVYNLKVKKLHVYAVGNTGVLVHNKGPKPTPNFKPPTNPAQLPLKEFPPGWRVREMPPTQQYPNGYWRLEKPMPQGGWQGIDPSTMKPGAQCNTHVPLPPG